MSEVGSTLQTAFTIRELSGQKRSLRLRERALPYRPFELSGEQRNSVEWYNGSPVGTVQVYGAKEGQTTVTGAWKDMYLISDTRGSAPAEVDQSGFEVVDGVEALASSSTALTTARALTKVVDSIRRAGQEVEVTWLDQVRRGVLEKFTQKWHNGHDVDWEIMFTWSSQGEDLGDVAFRDDTASDLHDLPNKVHAELVDVLTDTSEVVPQAGDRAADLASTLDVSAGDIADLSDELTDTVSTLASVQTTANDALTRVAGILDGIKLKCDALSQQFSDIADGIALDSGSESIINEVASTFGQVLAVRADNRDRAAACTRLRDLAAREQHALLTRVTSTIIRAFQARDNQDLREVAQLYYGSPDAWRGLMVYNRLTSSELVAGQVVFVPAQPPDGSC